MSFAGKRCKQPSSNWFSLGLGVETDPSDNLRLLRRALLGLALNLDRVTAAVDNLLKNKQVNDWR